MYRTSLIRILNSDCTAAVDQLIQSLERAGFQIMPSFDLQAARITRLDCSCPYHGTDRCDCQMVVLLVYGQDSSPITLVAHGYNGQTRIAMVDTPGMQRSSHMVDEINLALFPINAS